VIPGWAETNQHFAFRAQKLVHDTQDARKYACRWRNCTNGYSTEMSTREPNEWICHAAQLLDLGPKTPAFPYKGYTEIQTLQDARTAITTHPIPQAFQDHLGPSCADGLAQLLLALNSVMRLHSTHLWLELRSPDHDPNFAWASACAHSCIIILPRTDPRTEDTARGIGEDVMRVMRTHARSTILDACGSLLWLAPILMNFNDTKKPGFGVQLTLEAHASGTSKAAERWQALVRFAANALATSLPRQV
jgi:hypothetical protein